jgi:hypothetical protein
VTYVCAVCIWEVFGDDCHCEQKCSLSLFGAYSTYGSALNKPMHGYNSAFTRFVYERSLAEFFLGVQKSIIRLVVLVH